MPRKTLTAFEPVTLPTEASAVSSWMAATLLAKVSSEKIPELVAALVKLKPAKFDTNELIVHKICEKPFDGMK